MNRFLLFSFILWCGHSVAQEKSLLWEITGPGLKQPSYLFGTIHIIPKKDYFFTETMEEKFNACQTLVLEVDINMSLNEQLALAKQMLLPDDNTIQHYLNEEQYKLFTSYLLDSLHVKPGKFKKVERVKPFFAFALVAKDLLGNVKFYEKELNKKAKKRKMKIVGLEKIQDQLDLVNKMTIREQLEASYQSTGSSYELMESFNQLLATYKSQDIDSLYDMMKEEGGMENFEQTFIIDRNRKWIPVIEKLISKQPSFIAVGAGHLAGEQGVIPLLREQGYSVLPVK